MKRQVLEVKAIRAVEAIIPHGALTQTVTNMV